MGDKLQLEFSVSQLRALRDAISFLAAGEWSETLTASEYRSLMAADREIRAALDAEGKEK